MSDSEPRWVERPPGGDPLEEHAAALFRRVEVPVRFAPAATPLLRPPRAGRPGSGLSSPASVALVAAGGAVLLATVAGLLSRPSASRTAPAAPVPRADVRSASRPARAPASLRADEPRAGHTRPIAAHVPANRRRRSASPEPVAADGPPPSVPDEAALLEAALVRLRQEHDPGGALTALDEHRRLFPTGTFAREAALARADALLVLGRAGEALAVLEAVPLETTGREGELRLIRAELRARSDCGRARQDFVALTDAGLPDPLAERVLYGLALCEERLGHRDRSERALRGYLSSFPSGRFAGEARRLLEGQR